MQMNIKGVRQARRLKKKGLSNYKIAQLMGVGVTQIKRWLKYALPWE